MAERIEVELWACVDSDGDYAVGKDEDATRDAYDSEIGGTAARRLVRVTVSVPLPAPVELYGTVPDDEAGAAATLKVG
jgi:hypothetical protein